MINVGLMDQLGVDAEQLLAKLPFSEWKYVKVEAFAPVHEVRYKFDKQGIEVLCDESNYITAIFVRPGDGERLIGVSFALRRQDVVKYFGNPSRSGKAKHVAGLREYGPWDRFMLPSGVIHFAFRADRDEIEMITLMRTDVAP